MNLHIFDHSVVGEFKSNSVKVIVVNPKVYYGGDDVSDIKGIQQLFDWANGIIK